MIEHYQNIDEDTKSHLRIVEVSASEIKSEKKADDRGRVTLGSEHAGETVTVAVLDVEDE